MKKIITAIFVLSLSTTFGQNFGTLSSGAFSSQGASVITGLILVQENQIAAVEQTFMESVKVYPNPTFDYFVIEGLEGEAYLYNGAGTVLSVVKVECLFKVDLSLDPNGTYILKLVTNKGTKSYKIVKQ